MEWSVLTPVLAAIWVAATVPVLHAILYAALGLTLNCPWIEVGGGTPWFTVRCGRRSLLVRRRWWAHAEVGDPGHVALPASRAKELLVWVLSYLALIMYMIVLVRVDYSAYPPGPPMQWAYPFAIVFMGVALLLAFMLPTSYPYGARRLYALSGSTTSFNRRARRAKRFSTVMSDTGLLVRVERRFKKQDYESVVNDVEQLLDGDTADEATWDALGQEGSALVALRYVQSLQALGSLEEADATCRTLIPKMATTSGDTGYDLIFVHWMILVELGRNAEALERIEPSGEVHDVAI